LLENYSEFSDSTPTFDCSAEGLKYICGFLAHKFRFTHPEFGTKTNENSVFEKVEAPWISALSRGGLTIPSTEFAQTIYAFEDIFKTIHGSDICTKEKVIASTIKIIEEKFPLFPKEVIKKYVRTRTFIRLKFMNQQLKANKEAKKRRNQMKIRHFSS
jgi:hypothetical protein